MSFGNKCCVAQKHEENQNISYILDSGSSHNAVKNKTDFINITKLFNEDVLRMESTTGSFLEHNEKDDNSILNV